ncbi:MAG: hypothetical protein LBI99_02670 [Propionibacteriaceae bacterium]|jgi:hypothetical protein|nr:hypothetical protein [Propionibacteriaceae bacterium]
MKSQAAYVPISATTGEPRRPALAWIVLLLSFAAITSFAVALGRSYWVCVYAFSQASLLTRLVPTEYGSPWRALLVVALTAIGLVPSIAAAISGFYVFAGYRWARVAAIITFALCVPGAWFISILAYPAIALTLAAAILAWLPPVGKYCATWSLLRNRAPAFTPPVANVRYGPLERYLDAQTDQNAEPRHA